MNFNKTRRHFWIIAILFFFNKLFAQTPIQIIASYDAAIGYHDYYPTSSNNYWDALQNAAYCIPGYNGGVNSNRAVIYFDLSDIPSDAIIISAKLNLYALGPIGSLPGHLGFNNSTSISRITEDWNEYEVSWDNQPLISDFNQVILAHTNNSLQDFLNIEALDLLNDMRKFGNKGIMLKLINEITSNGLLFCSTNYPNVAKHPMLDIAYALPSSTNFIDRKITFNIYPNPSSDFIIVRFDQSEFNDKNYLIEIYSIEGMLLKTYQIESAIFSMEISDLNSGTYIIKATSNMDKSTVVKKFSVVK